MVGLEAVRFRLITNQKHSARIMSFLHPFQHCDGEHCIAIDIDFCKLALPSKMDAPDCVASTPEKRPLDAELVTASKSKRRKLTLKHVEPVQCQTQEVDDSDVVGNARPPAAKTARTVRTLDGSDECCSGCETRRRTITILHEKYFGLLLVCCETSIQALPISSV